MADNITVLIPTAMRPKVGEQESISATGSTVKDVLGGIGTDHPEFAAQMFDANNNVNRFINVFVNDEDIRFLENLDTALKDGDEVSIVPAIAGG